MSFLLGLMGISQRETIIEKSIELHCVVHLVFGVQGYFLKMEDQFRGFREDGSEYTHAIHFQVFVAAPIRIAEF